MRRSLRRSLVLTAVVAAVLWAPAGATAHPLGNFTVNVYAGITLVPGEVEIAYVVDLAEIPTLQLRPRMDADADGVVTSDEGSAWAERTAPDLAEGLSVSVDGEAVSLRVASASMRPSAGRGGLDVVRLEARFVGAVGSAGTLSFADTNFADRIGWREVSAVGARGVALPASSVPTRSVSSALRTYPRNLLSSPLRVVEATVSFRPGPSVPPDGSDRDLAAAVFPGRADAFADLVSRTGPFMVLALMLAFGFGALHALGPGHGKALAAAYLVGAGGRARHAAAVGGSVAVMHTASVLALGFAVLMVTEVFAPERVYPWLGLASGLIALALGASLLVARLGRWGSHHPRGQAHDDPGEGSSGAGPPHPHPPVHPHPHPARPLSRRSLTALAVAGGILPSPSALVVLLAAVAVDRVAYGLALIGAFSLGLAAALVVVGIVALRARDAVAGRMSGRVARLVPVLSAASIAVLGLALTVRGFAQL